MISKMLACESLTTLVGPAVHVAPLTDVNTSARLEIGAGGGLVGLAVAKGCAVSQSQPVYVTDQLEMLSLMQHNVVLNGVEGRVKPMVLNWCVARTGTFFPLFPPSHIASALRASTRNLVYISVASKWMDAALSQPSAGPTDALCLDL